MNRLASLMLALALGGTIFVASGGSALALITQTTFSQGQCFYPDGTTAFQNKTANNPGDTVTITAPTGSVITAVAVHDGNANPNLGQDQCAFFSSNGTFLNCYTVTGLNTATVTVTRNTANSQCGGISFVSYDTGPGGTTTTSTTTTSPTGATQTGATPEMDSIVLFGVGVLALSGFGLYQRRRGARRS
jgi:hypothetical protein